MFHPSPRRREALRRPKRSSHCEAAPLKCALCNPIMDVRTLDPGNLCHAAAAQQGRGPLRGIFDKRNATWRRRSEEHTSELQSLMRISYAVFCLKKKHTHKTKKSTRQKC